MSAPLRLWPRCRQGQGVAPDPRRAGIVGVPRESGQEDRERRGQLAHVAGRRLDKAVYFPSSACYNLPMTISALRASGKLPLVVLFLLLQVGDITTTALSFRRGAVEANLLPAWILRHWGELGMYLFKVVLVLMVLCAVLHLQSRFPRIWLALRVVNVVMVFVLIINLTSIFL